MIFLRRARHVVSIVTLLLCLAACAFAESQPPTPSPSIGSQSPQQQAAPQNTQPNNPDAPVVTTSGQPPTQQPSNATSPQDPQPPTNWWAWFTANGSNWIITFLTFVLAGVGFAQWWATHTANKHNIVIERAYLALSHHPPGIVIDPLVINAPGDAKQNVSVRVGVKNLGNTPANVTYALIQLFITNQPLPELPPYDESLLKRLWINVVKTDDFALFQNHLMDLSGIEEIRKDGVLRLYVLGYTDYIDKFGVRHRCGYARAYNPSEDDPRRYLNEDGKTINQKAAAKRNNLPFVTEPNYNYDRERKKGEGKDWGEKT